MGLIGIIERFPGCLSVLGGSLYMVNARPTSDMSPPPPSPPAPPDCWLSSVLILKRPATLQA